MGVFDRLADATRATFGSKDRDQRARGSDEKARRKAGRTEADGKMAQVDGKALKELSDAELDAELQRRRRARGRGRTTTTSEPRKKDGSIPGWKIREDTRRWYRALELEPGATLADVEASYQRLLERYDPDKHAEDPEKHRLATRLAAGLGEAYYGLRDQLDAG